MPKILFEIVIRGVIADDVIALIEGFQVVSVSDAGTTLRGWVVDQSGLHGVLDRIGGLGLELSSVAPVGGCQRRPDDDQPSGAEVPLG